LCNYSTNLELIQIKQWYIQPNLRNNYFHL